MGYGNSFQLFLRRTLQRSVILLNL